MTNERKVISVSLNMDEYKKFLTIKEMYDDSIFTVTNSDVIRMCINMYADLIDEMQKNGNIKLDRLK